MAITQSAFERELQIRLHSAGFDLNRKDTVELLELVGQTVTDALRSDMKAQGKNGGTPAVTVRGLGKFSVRHRPAGWGRNPGTGEKIRVKASKRMKVLAPKPMRDALRVK